MFSELKNKLTGKTSDKSKLNGYAQQEEVKPQTSVIDAFVDSIRGAKRHKYADSEWNVCLATDGVEIVPFMRSRVWIDNGGDVIQIYETKIVPIDSPATLKLNWFIENLEKDGFEKEAESLDMVTRAWRDNQVEMKMIYSSEPDYEFAIGNCRFLFDPEYK